MNKVSVVEDVIPGASAADSPVSVAPLTNTSITLRDRSSAQSVKRTTPLYYVVGSSFEKLNRKL